MQNGTRLTAVEQLRSDLSPFCDPATELRISEGTAGVRIQLSRNAVDHDYFYSASDGTLVARHLKGRQIASLRSLLASTDFADLRSFVHTQNRIHANFDVDGLIPPEGQVQSERLTLQSLHRALTPPKIEGEARKLRIVLVDGPAGVGKTSLIELIVVQRARRQKDASSAPPVLHVKSRGRRLSGLDDALAQSIDLMRAKFTYDQVPVLIRHNLLQVAIDGFDELVDPEGYKDAWYALRDFFAATSFGGPLVLAGRDTFFDQQGFMTQLQDAPVASELIHVRLGPVTPAKAKDWLREQGWSYDDTRSPAARVVLRTGSYALRPYFLRQLADMASWKAISTTDITPRAFLVDRFVRREAGLISQQLSIDEEQAQERLSGLFEEIASEMADTESEAVDLAFLQLATEIAFGNQLSQQDLAKLQHKAGSFALLETDDREGYRRFPHTEISNHFLAAALIRMISSGAYTRFLRRGILTADLLNIFAEILLKENEKVVVGLTRNLGRMLSDEVSFDRLSSNAAALLLTSLCCPWSGEDRVLSDISPLDAVLFGAIEPALLRRVHIQRLEAKEADLTGLTFENCEITNLTADDTTQFGRSCPTIHRLMVASKDGGITEISEPGEISGWLQEHSQAEREDIENMEALHLLDKVCRVMLRQHLIKEHQEDRAGRLLRSPQWEGIEEVLVREKWLERIEGKPSSGAAANFVRMKDPYKLLVEREDPKVKVVWDQVAALPY